ncbi:MAG TPA: hypothetical protein VFN23_15795, partial [Ktedonobacteraceae bacterium]|nr:hypothetical protein [Ktedonobacteraceae bacterium]
ILCISEVVEDEEGLILYLHDKGLTPNTRLKVLSTLPSDEEAEENFRVQMDDQAVLISKSAASKIWATRP